MSSLDDTEELITSESLARSSAAYNPKELEKRFSTGDRVIKALRIYLPLSWQNRFRDSGAFRNVSDTIVTLTAPLMAITNPSIAVNFLKLNSMMSIVPYGDHPMQIIQLFVPSQCDVDDNNEPKGGFLFFVHGGAWGSGQPWMYRLVALPFLKIGVTVAIVGYRTYPDADVEGQVTDVISATNLLLRTKPHLFYPPDSGCLGACMMGHSSGAHIGLHSLIHSLDRNTPIPFHYLIGLSGPYCISSHFEYEAHRGVEEISPMKAACGHTRNSFHHNSPHKRLSVILSGLQSNHHMTLSLPKLLFVHGMEDTTVPFTASADAAKLIRALDVFDVQEMYLAKLSHADTIIHFMLGGKTCHRVLLWLQQQQTSNPDLSSQNYTFQSSL